MNISAVRPLVNVNGLNRKISGSNQSRSGKYLSQDVVFENKQPFAMFHNNIAGQFAKLKTPKSVAFRGTPLVLPPIDIIDASDAIAQYDCLCCGSYLDVHDDNYNPDNKKIRARNLSFLDELVTPEEQSGFIKHFEEVTGFPSLATVSERIENEYKNSILRTSEELGNGIYTCVAAGYDGTCSVGKRRALPGSDLDKSFIILQGTSDPAKNDEIVNEYKGRLWNNTDQRVLSYNHDTSFPTVITVQQVLDNIAAINSRINGLDFDRAKMAFLVENEYSDLEKAAEFNILVSDRFARRNTYLHPDDKLTKEDVKNFAYFIESYRDGKPVIQTQMSDFLRQGIESSNFYKYSNVAQMRAMANAISSGKEQKSKIIKRQNMEANFYSWPVEEQYNFVKTLIKYSCEDQCEYGEYFSNDHDIKAKYKPLLGRITKGSRDELYIPEFSEIDNGVNMNYGKGKSVNLYSGYIHNSLWIDSDNPEDIMRVLEEIDRIKSINRFRWVETINCPKPAYTIDKFKPLNEFTSSGVRIYEAKL